jgi:hypothetical protein
MNGCKHTAKMAGSYADEIKHCGGDLSAEHQDTSHVISVPV